MAAHDRHRAEFAHRPRVAKDDAVKQSPFDVRHRHPPERLPAAGAQHARGLLLDPALRLHERNQFARDKRKRHKHRRQHDAGHGKNDLDVVRQKPRTEQPLRAKQQHVNQSGNDGRNRERQINQRDEHGFAAEIEFRNRPRRRHAEDAIQRHGDAGGDERQFDGAQGVRVVERVKIETGALGERLRENRRQRHDQEQTEKQQRRADEQPAHEGPLGRHAALRGAARGGEG